jgi:hypothetical protein
MTQNKRKRFKERQEYSKGIKKTDILILYTQNKSLRYGSVQYVQRVKGKYCGKGRKEFLTKK